MTDRTREMLALATKYAAMPADKRRLFRARFAERGLGAAGLPIVPLAARTDRFPLSYAQERLWFLWKLDPENVSYNLPSAVRLRGELDLAAVRRAIDSLVQRHDILRTRFQEEDGKGYQRVDTGARYEFVEKNVVGTLKLIEAARKANVGRFVFISTCAVYDKILPGRPLDETHPLWPNRHYGAHKAAIEKFVHSYGYDMGCPICALRPTGAYGAAHPPKDSKWFDLVRAVARGRTNGEIAAELYISLSTVKAHVTSLMTKLGARNRVEIAMWAYDTGRVGD